MPLLRFAVFLLCCFFAGEAWAHPWWYHDLTQTKTAVITYDGERFTPSKVEVDPGGHVLFLNKSDQDFWPASDDHPTHQGYEGFDAKKPIPPGKAWVYTFLEQGAWGFHNHLTPDQIGEVVVSDLVAAPLAGLPGESAVVVVYQRGGFSPQTVQVAQGEHVIFTNTSDWPFWPASNDHPTHELLPSFDAKKPILTGDSFVVTMDQLGEWGYHNHLSPLEAGTIQVREAGEISSDGIARAAPDDQGDGVSSGEIDVAPIYGDHACAAIDYACIAKAVRATTDDNGPQAAVELLASLVTDGLVDPRVVDEHQLAHEIGRQTAETYGVGSEAFLRCPMSAYNGGCQHGYFENVLGKTDSTTDAADRICKAMAGIYSKKDFFYCYHGVGHGVMMAQAYDLDTSLQTCDELGEPMARDGCWQGVFMENVNAGMNGTARQGLFTKDDPLAPCNRLEAKYRNECYLNHSGWLIVVFNFDLERAVGACLEADPRFVGACLQSLGLMVTNPLWQKEFFKATWWQKVQLELFGVAFGAGFEEVSWQLCQAFPSERRDECVRGAVDNVLNFDKFDVSRAEGFCNLVDEELRSLCYTRIGLNLTNQATEEAAVREKCLLFEGADWDACLIGAGL